MCSDPLDLDLTLNLDLRPDQIRPDQIRSDQINRGEPGGGGGGASTAPSSFFFERPGRIVVVLR